MTAHGAGIGLGFWVANRTATRKWLWDNEKSVVGATGFEPVTSTV